MILHPKRIWDIFFIITEFRRIFFSLSAQIFSQVGHYTLFSKRESRHIFRKEKKKKKFASYCSFIIVNIFFLPLSFLY